MEVTRCQAAAESESERRSDACVAMAMERHMHVTDMIRDSCERTFSCARLC